MNMGKRTASLAVGHEIGANNEICALTGAGHIWKCREYEKRIVRSSCQCGRILFETSILFPSQETLARLKFLNERHGKPGKVYGGPARPVNISQKINQSVNKKEERNMVAQINAKELLPETREKLGLTKEAVKIAEKLGEQVAGPPPDLKSGAGENLPPIPAKPAFDISKGGAGWAIRRYYEDNKAAILQWYGVKGEAATKEAWGFAPGSWAKFKKRHIANANQQQAEKEKITPARKAQIEKRRAARGKKCDACSHRYYGGTKENPDVWCDSKKCPSRIPTTLRLPYKPIDEDKIVFRNFNGTRTEMRKENPPPPEGRKYVCLDDCQCPAGECKYSDKKTADPAAGNCPGYLKPEKKYYCPDDCILRGIECPVNLHGIESPSGAKIPPVLTYDANNPRCPHYKAPAEVKRYFCPANCAMHLNGCKDGNLCPGPLVYDHGYGICPQYKAMAGQPEQKVESGSPEIHTIIYKINTRQLEEEIEDAKNRVKFLNQLRCLCLPSFRWYWVFFPTTIRHYFSALREIVKK